MPRNPDAKDVPVAVRLSKADGAALNRVAATLSVNNSDALRILIRHGDEVLKTGLTLKQAEWQASLKALEPALEEWARTEMAKRRARAASIKPAPTGAPPSGANAGQPASQPRSPAEEEERAAEAADRLRAARLLNTGSSK